MISSSNPTPLGGPGQWPAERNETNMSSLNKLLFAGFLVRDPELRYTAKGKPVCNLTVASHRVRSSDPVETAEEITFVEFAAWGHTGETIASGFKKGQAIIIEGRLKNDSWEDKQTGQKKTKLKAVVEDFSHVVPTKAEGSAAFVERGE